MLLRPTVPIKDGIAVKMGFAPLFNGICALGAGRLRKKQYAYPSLFRKHY